VCKCTLTERLPRGSPVLPHMTVALPLLHRFRCRGCRPREVVVVERRARKSQHSYLGHAEGIVVMRIVSWSRGSYRPTSTIIEPRRYVYGNRATGPGSVKSYCTVTADGHTCGRGSCFWWVICEIVE
jgi:hypothetical protein